MILNFFPYQELCFFDHFVKHAGNLAHVAQLQGNVAHKDKYLLMAKTTEM